MVAVVTAVTVVVLTTNAPVRLFAGTDTVAGTVALFDEDASLTLIAPLLVPGIALRVTVPVEDSVAPTVVGESERLTSWNGLTLNTTFCETPLNVAVIVVEFAADTNR